MSVAGHSAKNAFSLFSLYLICLAPPYLESVVYQRKTGLK